MGRGEESHPHHEPAPDWHAVERIADLDGNPLPNPVRKGVFCCFEIAHEYLGQHHGPYPYSAFRVGRMIQNERGMWVMPEAEPQAEL